MIDEFMIIRNFYPEFPQNFYYAENTGRFAGRGYLTFSPGKDRVFRIDSLSDYPVTLDEEFYVNEAIRRVECILGGTINYSFMNIYRQGFDFGTYHTDGESNTAILNIGGRAKFKIADNVYPRHLDGYYATHLKNIRGNILRHGDLVLMPKGTPHSVECWDKRYSLVMRDVRI